MQQNLKHSYSERMQLVPAQLMALVDDVIAVFHTDACSGAADREARLVPGLASQHFGGQETLWTALKQAAYEAGVTTVTLNGFTRTVHGTVSSRTASSASSAPHDEWTGQPPKP